MKKDKTKEEIIINERTNWNKLISARWRKPLFQFWSALLINALKWKTQTEFLMRRHFSPMPLKDCAQIPHTNWLSYLLSIEFIQTSPVVSFCLFSINTLNTFLTSVCPLPAKSQRNIEHNSKRNSGYVYMKSYFLCILIIIFYKFA